MISRRMDFGHQSWDVSQDASHLAASLFTTSGKSSKKSKKRRSKDAVLDGPLDKKAKLEIEKKEDAISAGRKKRKRKKKNKGQANQDFENEGNDRDSSKSEESVLKITSSDDKKKVKKRKNKKRNATNGLLEGVDMEVTSHNNDDLTVESGKHKLKTANVKDELESSAFEKKNGKKAEVSQSVNVDPNESSPSTRKRKRKRKCKKNKFKDYTKESDTQDNSFKDKLENTSKESAGHAKKVSAETSDKSFTKKRKRSEVPDTVESADDMVKTPKVTLSKGEGKTKQTKTRTEKMQPNKRSQVTKSPFDPKILNNVLSAEKKKVNKTDSREESVGQNIHVEQDVPLREKSTNKSKPKSLLEKNRERLNAARFRYLNEQMYTSTGNEALKMFQGDNAAFHVYHEGFQSQVEKWPTNPLDIIIEELKNKPNHLVVADFGCGDAKLARSIRNKVHSFDLVALNDYVTACDMSKVPLPSSSVDVAVFCLSLMGTNLLSYLKEANRILKQGGLLKVAEVSSRFDNIGSFVLQVESLGFKVLHQDSENKMFVRMDFRKVTDSDKKKSVKDISLYPCLYKKR